MRLEKVSKGLGEIGVKFEEFVEKQDALARAKVAQRFAVIAAQMVDDRREDFHLLSEECVAAEADLSEGLGFWALVGDTAAATDRDNKELKYTQEALRLVVCLVRRATTTTRFLR